MQVVTIHLIKDEFHCPFSGEMIFENGEINESVGSFAGYWLDEFWESPTICDESIQKEWDMYSSSLASSSSISRMSNPSLLLEAFFIQLERHGFLVFKLIDKIPISPTLYLMLHN